MSHYELKKRMEQPHVDAIQFDEQGNIIFNELEQKERDSDHWQNLEKKYGINFGDVVKLGDHLGRVLQLSVSNKYKDSDGLLREDVYIKLGDGKNFNTHCSEAGDSVKELLEGIKMQKKLSIKEKIKNTIKTNVQTLKKTLKKGGAAERLANRRVNEKATNTQTKPSASQSASQRLKNKRALKNTQGLER